MHPVESSEVIQKKYSRINFRSTEKNQQYRLHPVLSAGARADPAPQRRGGPRLPAPALALQQPAVAFLQQVRIHKLPPFFFFPFFKAMIIMTKVRDHENTVRNKSVITLEIYSY